MKGNFVALPLVRIFRWHKLSGLPSSTPWTGGYWGGTRDSFDIWNCVDV